MNDVERETKEVYIRDGNGSGSTIAIAVLLAVIVLLVLAGLFFLRGQTPDDGFDATIDVNLPESAVPGGGDGDGSTGQ